MKKVDTQVTQGLFMSINIPFFFWDVLMIMIIWIMSKIVHVAEHIVYWESLQTQQNLTTFSQ